MQLKKYNRLRNRNRFIAAGIKPPAFVEGQHPNWAQNVASVITNPQDSAVLAVLK